MVLPHPLSLQMTLVIKFHAGGGSEKKPVRCMCVCVGGGGRSVKGCLNLSRLPETLFFHLCYSR